MLVGEKENKTTSPPTHPILSHKREVSNPRSNEKRRKGMKYLSSSHGGRHRRNAASETAETHVVTKANDPLITAKMLDNAVDVVNARLQSVRRSMNNNPTRRRKDDSFDEDSYTSRSETDDDDTGTMDDTTTGDDSLLDDTCDDSLRREDSLDDSLLREETNTYDTEGEDTADREERDWAQGDDECREPVEDSRGEVSRNRAVDRYQPQPSNHRQRQDKRRSQATIHFPAPKPVPSKKARDSSSSNHNQTQNSSSNQDLKVENEKLLNEWKAMKKQLEQVEKQSNKLNKGSNHKSRSDKNPKKETKQDKHTDVQRQSRSRPQKVDNNNNNNIEKMRSMGSLNRREDGYAIEVMPSATGDETFIMESLAENGFSCYPSSSHYDENEDDNSIFEAMQVPPQLITIRENEELKTQHRHRRQKEKDQGSAYSLAHSLDTEKAKNTFGIQAQFQDWFTPEPLGFVFKSKLEESQRREEALQVQLDQCRSQCEVHEYDLARAADRERKMENVITTKKGKIVELKEAIEKMKARIKDLEETERVQSTDNDHLSEQLKQSRKELASLELKLEKSDMKEKELLDTIATTTVELEKARQAMAMSEGKIMELHKDMEIFQLELDVARERSKQVEGENEELVGLHRNQEEMKGLMGRVNTAMKNRIAEQSEQIAEFTAKMEALTTRESKLQKELDDTKAELKEKDDDLNATTQKVESLLRVIHGNEGEIETAQARIALLEKDIAKLRDSLKKEKEALLSQQDAEKQELEGEIEAHKRKIENLQTQLDEKVEEIGQLEKDMESTKKQAEADNEEWMKKQEDQEKDHQKELSIRQGNVDKAKEQIVLLENELLELRGTMVLEKAQFQDKSSEHKGAIEGFQAKLKEAEEREAELQKSLAEGHDRIASSIKEIEELESRCQQGKEALATKEKELKETTDRVHELEAEMEELHCHAGRTMQDHADEERRTIAELQKSLDEAYARSNELNMQLEASKQETDLVRKNLQETNQRFKEVELLLATNTGKLELSQGRADETSRIVKDLQFNNRALVEERNLLQVELKAMDAKLNATIVELKKKEIDQEKAACESKLLEADKQKEQVKKQTAVEYTLRSDLEQSQLRNWYLEREVNRLLRLNEDLESKLLQQGKDWQGHQQQGYCGLSTIFTSTSPWGLSQESQRKSLKEVKFDIPVANDLQKKQKQKRDEKDELIAALKKESIEKMSSRAASISKKRTSLDQKSVIKKSKSGSKSSSSSSSRKSKD